VAIASSPADLSPDSFSPSSSFILTAVPSKSLSSQPAVSPARSAAFDILLRVERDSSYASELLHSPAYDRLTNLDHALMTELVMGVLRWQSLLDSEISANSSQPLRKLDLEILIALRLALYQLRSLSRIPQRAAIHESVELVKRARKRSAASFVNAVLRKLAAHVSSLQQRIFDSSSPETLAASSAHPRWMVERWAEVYGLEVVARICQHDQTIPVTTIRLRSADAEIKLAAEGIALASGSLLTSARRVVHGNVAATAAFRAGLCMIQDEASQLVAALVGRGARILDCCAAPGGKTLAIADRNPDANIFALELHPHRANLLRQLLQGNHRSAGAEMRNIHVISGDAGALPFAAHFDRVLADVPCSGTGTLARNPEIKWRFTFEDLADLQARQIAILRSAMTQVAAGGRLIYSTCSLEREENEDVIERCISEDSSFRVIDCGAELEKLKQRGELIWPDPASLTQGPYLRTLPGIHPCDGFFAAILEKT